MNYKPAYNVYWPVEWGLYYNLKFYASKFHEFRQINVGQEKANDKSFIKPFFSLFCVEFLGFAFEINWPLAFFPFFRIVTTSKIKKE